MDSLRIQNDKERNDDDENEDDGDSDEDNTPTLRNLVNLNLRLDAAFIHKRR